ncbi:hypothetical protein HOLleu_34611 [Holothuria leucospilota]|uniref:IgGFc-binding protein N-terminal domain-containing protein n=1 Tax=Holothuria leucospilota TaxID=206669 RepID=A0A9Q1BEC0_HOLLE|nr:hypothetical protein HOLleu_34611 [Holothuria leucospilota]
MVIMLRVFVVAIFVTLVVCVTKAIGEPICYAKEKKDATNVIVTRVNCNRDTEKYDSDLLKMFTSEEKFSITELLLDRTDDGMAFDQWEQTGQPESTISSTDVPPTTLQLTPNTEIPSKFVFVLLSLGCTGNTLVEIYIGTISTQRGAVGRIFFPLIDIPDVIFTLGPGEGKFFTLPDTVVPKNYDFYKTLNTTVIVEADVTVSVYGHVQCNKGLTNRRRATASRIIPVRDLSSEYWVNLWWKVGVSQLGIVATEEGTTEISLSFKGSSSNFSIHQYETYYLGGSFSITGMHIVADKLLYVVACNLQENAISDKNGRDGICETLEPVSNWGNDFSLVPFPRMELVFENYGLEVFSAEDDTVITLLGKVVSNYSMSRGEARFIEIPKEVNNSFDLISSKPILLAQFSGRLSMIYVPSLSSCDRKKEIMFPVWGFGNKGERMFLNIWVSPGVSPSSIELNNKTHTDWKIIGEDYEGNVIFQKSLLEVSHTIKFRNGDALLAIVYGTVEKLSYAFPLW